MQSTNGENGIFLPTYQLIELQRELEKAKYQLAEAAHELLDSEAEVRFSLVDN